MALAGALVVVAGYFVHRTRQPGTLTVELRAVVGDEPLTLNQVRYDNPGGAGRFKIRAFQFYLSNLRLVSPGGEYNEPDSYHLARFDNADNSYRIVLNGVPRRVYERIEFAIGVDPAANKSIAPIGDLDPNSRMAWNWEVGYKFILFEGGLELDDALVPLVYHVGFDENYKTVAIHLEEPLFDEAQASLSLNVDVMKLFTARSVVDMTALSSVKFDKADAKLIADNYAHMILPASGQFMRTTSP